MKITLESTSRVVTINGIPARLWQGTTANGIPCHAFITRIGVDRTLDATEFERDLTETTPLRADLAVIPLRMIL